MRFAWNQPADDGASDDERSSTEPAADGERTPAELLLDGGEARVGWIDTEGQRTSDWLNAHPRVPVQGLGSGDGLGAAPDAGAPVEELDRDRIVWVVPPPLPANRHLRLHRRRILVHLELDDHEVSGQVHVRPGADAVDQVMRGTRELVPLTEVQVVSKSNPGRGAAVPVLIVNRIHVRRVVEDTPHVSAAVSDPAPSPADAPVDPRIALLVPDASPAVDQPVAEAESPTPEASVPDAADEPSGIEMLHAALTLLLEAGMVDVVEFQSIRGRIPTPPSA